MDWAELDHELLRNIAKKVTDISDYVRLRAVCKRWHSVVRLSDMALQFPCFINLKWESITSTSFDIQFRQCFSEKVRIVSVNNISIDGEIRSMLSSSSEFIVLKIKKISKPWLLLNPLTGFNISLPFTRNGKHAFPIYFGRKCYPEMNPMRSFIDVVFILEEKDPLSESRDFEVCLWRYDDTKWTRIAQVACSIGQEHVTYCDGRICAISQETGHTRVTDIATGKESVIRGLPMRLMYLIEVDGNLLCVFRNLMLETGNTQDAEYQFEVYQLENFGTDPPMRKLNSVGNWVIFIDSIHSGFCLKASDCEGYRSNCIYLRTYVISESEVNCAVVRYDIENDTTEVTLSSDPLDSQWFVPRLF